MRLIFIFTVFVSLSAHAGSGANQQTLQALKWELWEEGVSAQKENPVKKNLKIFYNYFQ